MTKEIYGIRRSVELRKNDRIIIMYGDTHYWGYQDKSIKNMAKTIVESVIKNRGQLYLEVDTREKKNEEGLKNISENQMYSTIIRNICKEGKEKLGNKIIF